MRTLSAVQMAELAIEAMRNSRRLLEDAAALAEAQRLPSAFMLTGLAADELGKHILVASFYSREGTEDDWRKFWRRFRDHTEKLGDALIGAWIGDLLADEPPPRANDFHKQRLASTYVDISGDGTITTPTIAISREAFDAAFESIDRELTYCEGVLAHATPEQLGATLESMRTSPHGRALTELSEELGAEAAMAFAIALRSGMGASYATAFARQASRMLGHLGPQSQP